MNIQCKEVVNHISRLEGQLRRLKNDIESNQSCEKIVQLSLSSAKSFDSLRAKIITAYIEQNVLPDASASVDLQKDLQKLYSLIKA